MLIQIALMTSTASNRTILAGKPSIPDIYGALLSTAVFRFG